MIFKKYEFASETEWLTTKDSLNEEGVLMEEVVAIHEIGFTCTSTDEETGECLTTSNKYYVDILLNEDIAWLEAYAAYPIPSNSLHYFAGLEHLYLKSYCNENPTSELCTIPSHE